MDCAAGTVGTFDAAPSILWNLRGGSTFVVCVEGVTYDLAARALWRFVGTTEEVVCDIKGLAGDGAFLG